MNELLFHDPFSNMFKEMEALMDFDFKRESRGLKKWIKKPHNLITRKDENGKVIGFALEVVYTPFKKSDVKVEILDGDTSKDTGTTDNKETGVEDYFIALGTIGIAVTALLYVVDKKNVFKKI